jgi:hypothetical protein
MPAKALPHVLAPFNRERSAHITVACMLSGKAARFLVDTGAGGTCIDSGALEAYGLALKGRSKKGGGVGSASMQLTTVSKHDLHLAGLNLSRYTLHALDLSHVNAGLAADKVAPIVGVLGADILHDRQAVIDYGRQFIVLSSTTPPKPNH